MRGIDAFFNEGIDRYFDTLDEHDPECERRLRLHMCNCSKRKRIASGLTTPPTLIYQAPVCDNCWKEVEHDGDGWYCPRCSTAWPTNGYDDKGTFSDDNGEDLRDPKFEAHGPRLILGDPR